MNLPHNSFKKTIDDHTTKYPVFAIKHKHLMKHFNFETFYWDWDTYVKPEYLLVSIYGLFQAIMLINNLVSLFFQDDYWIKSRPIVIGTQFVMLSLFGIIQFWHGMNVWDHRHRFGWDHRRRVYPELIKFVFVYFMVLATFVILILKQFTRVQQNSTNRPV